MKVFSFGGGVQSNAALVLAAQGKIDYKTFLFCNVGDDSENPDTIQYVRDVSSKYALDNGIEFHEISRSGDSIYQRLLNNEKSIGIPIRGENGAPGKRDCTHAYKVQVIRKWLGKGEHIVGLGISLDEYQRMRSDSGIKNITNEYPLIGLRLTRMECLKIIKDAGLPQPPKSACWFCPYHTLAAWRNLKADKPALFDKACQLEDVLRDRRKTTGRGDVFLTSKAIPLRDAFGDQMSMFIDDSSCESGYCMV